MFPDVDPNIIILALSYVGIEGAADLVRAFMSMRVQAKVIERDIASLQMGEGVVSDLPKKDMRPVPGQY